jgi:23S rRNA (uracil1939-C5)-methyltransferase
MPATETKNSRITVPVEKLVYGGDALARSNGQVVLLPFALPGESVEVETRAGKGRVLRGSNTRVLTPSTRRVEPGCEYFGTCGGCQYQHAGYAYQVEQKVAILTETLRRLGAITFSCPVETISAEPWGYRNRIQLHIERRQLGFRRADSHELCPITHCPISSPRLNEVISILNSAVTRPEWPGFLSGVELFTNETDVQLNVTETGRPVAARFFSWCAELIPGLVANALEYKAGPHSLRVSRGTFFQVNRFLVEALVNKVAALYTGETVLDLYAGAGLFSLPLRERFSHVTAVERGTSAFRDLEHNGQDRIATVRAATNEYLKELTVVPQLIVADPPRVGLDSEVTRELLRLQAPNLVIVSCDPATLARDLKNLTTAYEIQRVALIDLFPQTFHFETVVHLALNRSERGL